jgi:hypothetical protein
MRSNFQMVCGEGDELIKVWIEHHISTKMDEFDEVLLPRLCPSIRTSFRHDHLIYTECKLGQTDTEIRVELAPVFWKVDRSPAAGYLGKVRCVVSCQVLSCKDCSSIEELSAFRPGLDILLLIKANPKELR